MEWVPFLTLSNVWVLVVGVIWFRGMTILVLPLPFGFVPSYDLSYASIPHLKGLQQISDLIHPKVTAHPVAAFHTVIVKFAHE